MIYPRLPKVLKVKRAVEPFADEVEIQLARSELISAYESAPSRAPQFQGSTPGRSAKTRDEHVTRHDF